jgi:1-acyl-sn-glycerol-3-phosphate acyltransferase
LRKSSQERQKVPGQVPLVITRSIATGGLRMLGGLTTSGGENIKNIEGPYVQCSPHSSILDIPAKGIAAHRVDNQQLQYITKDNLDLPIVGWWLAQGGSIFINREIGLTAENHIDIAARAKENAAFATWPTGHRYHGPIQREQVASLVIVPLVFEHNLTVEPVGVAGTEPGDLGFFHVEYGEPFKPDPIDFEADPSWDHRRRPAKLAQAIKHQLGKDAIDNFMEELYLGMARAEQEAIELRAERMARRKITRTILSPVTKGSGKIFKEKEFKLNAAD